MLHELRAYPAPPEPAGRAPAAAEEPGIVVPLVLRAGDEVLSFVSTTTVFGTPVEVTLAELALESFFPADAATAAFLRKLAAAADKVGRSTDRGAAGS